MIDRRTFLAGTGAVLLATPLAAGAQQAGKVWRIVTMQEDFTSSPPLGQGPFFDRMRELGWVYGQNFVMERRTWGDQIERVPDLAAEVIRSGVDVFIVPGEGAARPVQQVTRTIPIVTSTAADLVQNGLAASLGRPGGNVTGVQTLTRDLVGKQFSLLKEASPGLSRSGFLIPEFSSEAGRKFLQATIREAEASGKELGIRLQIVVVRRAEDFDTAFSAFRDQRAQGILVLRTPFIFAHRKTIVALALKHRLPTISEIFSFAREGGLMSYSFDPRDISRLMAETIDKILRGAKASEIPIQQPTTFQFVINLKTAKALGLTIPPSVLGRADEVIQ